MQLWLFLVCLLQFYLMKTHGAECLELYTCSCHSGMTTTPPSQTEKVPVPNTSTFVRRYDYEPGFCRSIGSTAIRSNNPYLRIEAHLHFALSCGQSIARTLMTLNEIDRLPSDTVVKSAEIKLFGLSFKELNNPFEAYSLSGEQGVTNEVLIKRILSAWNANTTNWLTQPSTTEVNAAIIPSTEPTAPGLHTGIELYNVTIDITQLVRDIQASGQENNNGVMLQMKTERRYRAMTFCSFHPSDIQRRPQIIITT